MNQTEIENKAVQTFVLSDVDESIDQDSSAEEVESQSTESAPVAEDAKNEVEVEKPVVEDGFQKRINKVTADKYAEIEKAKAATKRADDLQEKLNEYESKKTVLKKPTLEDHDYDTDALNAAEVEFQVQERLNAHIESQKKAATETSQSAEAQRIQDSFSEQITALGKDDFSEKVNSIPLLPNGVASIMMQQPNGAELAYHLANHLDVADSLAGMTANAAIMELGRISASLSAKPIIKTSAAPEPIETLNSGSVLTKERGPRGATYS